MVRWTSPATADLKKIFAYIAEDSKHYARQVVKNIVEKTETLNDFPEIGRTVPELNEKNIRELMIYSYRLVYEVKGGDVEIVAIIHGKRDFPKAYGK